MHRFKQASDDHEAQLQAAQAELDELRGLINSFEAVVDARLGTLLDQLSELNAVTSDLDAELRLIRERRLYGKDLITYLDGAPRPPRPQNLSDPLAKYAPLAGLPTLDLNHRRAAQSAPEHSPSPVPHAPDIKTLYRRLARLYHPDLARTDSDRRLSNEHMAEINRLYRAGDLPALMKLAGMDVPFMMSLNQPATPPERLTEQQRGERKLHAMRQEIARLNQLPILKLSLDVKLARHQRRDLLGEMAADLQYKVARKMAERDYLQAQINTSLHLGDAQSSDNSLTD